MKRILTGNSLLSLTLTLVLSVIVQFNAYSQFPFIQRKTWDGPYDIKMIAAPNLEPVYLDPTQAALSKLKADSVIKHSTMLMSGKELNINNAYKGGSPFVKLSDLTKQAAQCPDVNSPCTVGLPTQSPNSSCSVRYGSPSKLPDVFVSMTYADYDNDLTTFSSSMAELEMSPCSEIEAAYLYWTGSLKGTNDDITLYTPTKSYNGSGNVFITNSSAYPTVKFKMPGGNYVNVTAPAANVRIDAKRYLCVADVTNLVQGVGSGQFWVGNIQSYPNESEGGSCSGWVLTVVFRSPLSPPRLISLWDGLQSVDKGNSQDFVLSGLQAPATNNFKSYVGFAVLDGENLAAQIGKVAPEGLGFKTNNGGANFEINPYKTDQPLYRLWTDNGYPANSSGSDNKDGCNKPLFDATWASVYDGISSSHISSYSEKNGKNGNEIIRLPSNPNTLGLDAHHIKLPDGAVAPGATQATLTVNAGPQGGTNPFLAYIAIERLQPKLTMAKSADKNSTALSTDITYLLRIKNEGNDKSLGGDIIYDTLDIATDFIAGSLLSKSYVSGVATSPAGISLLSSADNRLRISVSQSIKAGDSIDISFKVRVKDYTSDLNLWDVQCKRSITNTAYIDYKTISSGVLQSKSNANDCGIGSETKVLIFDTQLGNSLVKKLGPFDASEYMSEEVIKHLRLALINAGVNAADITDYDLRDEFYNRLKSGEIFDASSAGLKFYAVRDYATSGNCQEIYEISYSFSILPVTFLSFEGQHENGRNVLSWSTLNEINNDRFIIERSINGREFELVGVVKGSGNTSSISEYYFSDIELNEYAYYYRVKQVDVNGMFMFSSVIQIENNVPQWQIFPNPNNGKFFVRFLSKSFEHMEISDATGKIIQMLDSSSPSEVSIEGVESGIYFARFYTTNSVYVKKIIVY
ncbi:MAG: T9SS type A sorting domain-containing protein [Sporocytophaga sp.]|uniref:T9SS type A sorting domain-containing protein n=1 Tax=Sporocytophaga sp. TaxID=2231183 RepID=UPI001B12E57B|nr:T9SS type A sorting domain-containing protein [Sporocytophaga sp.]MBO9700393.1 T9SS type A sorting domain-containing protein [Sporocytophaga sp.]